MKKRKNRKETVEYEDDPLGNYEIIADFLPPPELLRNAGVRIIKEEATLLVPLSEKDMRVLNSRAKRKGMSSQMFAAAILHAFAEHAS